MGGGDPGGGGGGGGGGDAAPHALNPKPPMNDRRERGGRGGVLCWPIYTLLRRLTMSMNPMKRALHPRARGRSRSVRGTPTGRFMVLMNQLQLYL